MDLVKAILDNMVEIDKDAEKEGEKEGEYVDLFDYAGNRHIRAGFIPDNTILAWIDVITGDEHLVVVDAHGDRRYYFADRGMADYFDGTYEIVRLGEWVVDREEWERRGNSYDWLDGHEAW